MVRGPIKTPTALLTEKLQHLRKEEKELRDQAVNTADLAVRLTSAADQVAREVAEYAQALADLGNN